MKVLCIFHKTHDLPSALHRTRECAVKRTGWFHRLPPHRPLCARVNYRTLDDTDLWADPASHFLCSCILVKIPPCRGPEASLQTEFSYRFKINVESFLSRLSTAWWATGTEADSGRCFILAELKGRWSWNLCSLEDPSLPSLTASVLALRTSCQFTSGLSPRSCCFALSSKSLKGLSYLLAPTGEGTSAAVAACVVSGSQSFLRGYRI